MPPSPARDADGQPVDPPSDPHDYRLTTALALSGTYAALGAWAWLAWYDDKPRLEHWKVGGDGWFGRDTYAGGADKVGHLWTAMVLTRLGAKLLRTGDWEPLSASLLSAGACSLALLWVEINDGYYTELSPGDLTANGVGALLGIAMDHWPALDDAIDLRLQWFPSAAYRERPSANIAEDYSGQTYLLAFKPGSIRSVRRAGSPLAMLRFVNPVLGFETRDYKPAPARGAIPVQRVFVGLTLDVQAVLDEALGNSTSRPARVAHEFGHVTFEYLNLPWTTLQLARVSRRSTRGDATQAIPTTNSHSKRD